jgi:DNA polymerase elongation subunit (family B)
LRKLYRENPQLFIEYNITDVELVDEIDEKEKVIDLCLTMAYDSKVNYEDVFSQVRMWDIIIYNKLRASKMVISPMTSHSKNEKYAGAYVKEPITGMHDWVASFDLTSLYPHLIMQFNISPDTLIHPKDYTQGMNNILRNFPISVEYLLKTRNPDLPAILREQGVTLTPNGQFFTIKKHGFLPEIMQTMFNDRKRYKKEMINAEKERESLKEELKKRGINK